MDAGELNKGRLKERHVVNLKPDHKLGVCRSPLLRKGVRLVRMMIHHVLSYLSFLNSNQKVDPVALLKTLETNDLIQQTPKALVSIAELFCCLTNVLLTFY